MKKTDRTSLVIFFVVVIIGYLVALAGSQGGSLIAGIPLFGLSVGLAFLVQWLCLSHPFGSRPKSSST